MMKKFNQSNKIQKFNEFKLILLVTIGNFLIIFNYLDEVVYFNFNI
jgi:hypothetical protein